MKPRLPWRTSMLLAVVVFGSGIFLPGFFLPGMALHAADSSGGPQSNANFDGFLSQHRQHNTIAGHFVQRKTIEALPMPLRSSGQFTYANTGKLTWETLQPVASSIGVYADRITQLNNRGETTELRAAQYPFISLLSTVFIGMIKGDLQQLEAHFLVTRVPVNDGWRLQLQPTDETFRQVFERIELAGDQVIRTMALYEKNGDRIEIQFLDLSFQ